MPNEQTSRTTHAAPPPSGTASGTASGAAIPSGRGMGANWNWGGGGGAAAGVAPCPLAGHVGGVAHAAPPPQHGLGRAAADGMTNGHADEWGEARASPGCAVEQRDGRTATGALAQVGEEARRLGSKRAMDRDGEWDQAHSGGQDSVLGVDAVGGDGGVYVR